MRSRVPPLIQLLPIEISKLDFFKKMSLNGHVFIGIELLPFVQLKPIVTTFDRQGQCFSARLCHAMRLIIPILVKQTYPVRLCFSF